MKRLYWIPKLMVLLLAAAALGFAARATAGSGYDYSRGELMGNSGLTIFREAAYGYQNGMSYLSG